MTPERLQEIRTRLTRGAPMFAVTGGLDLLEYIDLLHEDLRLTRAERDAEKKKRMADAEEIAALRRGQGTAPAPATPGTTPFHTTHPIPDSTGGTR